MDDGHSLMRLLVFLSFILLDAVFYGFGAAIQNVNIGKLEADAQGGCEKAAKLLNIVSHPYGFINTIQIVTTVIGMVTGGFVLGTLRQWLGGSLEHFALVSEAAAHIAGMVLAVLILLILLVSFGIVIPKHCGGKNPERWAYRAMPLVLFVGAPLRPMTMIISGISFLFLRMAGIDTNAGPENVTEEDIMSMVNEGHEQGVLEATEAEMITNIFEFTDKEAGDIMTHRKSVAALDAQVTLQDAIGFILSEGSNSRYPVYEKDMDDIIGILHMKDALISAETDGNRERKLAELDGLLRKPHFIPETRNISNLFQSMQSQKIHMVIVVDEYGQTAGIVTMEDILEEIVGNILDEYDEDEQFVVQSEDGSFVLDGMTPLEEAAEILKIQFEEEDSDTYDTVNGFLISRLNHIPVEGEDSEVEYQGYRFKILSVESKTIRSVRASRIQSEFGAVGSEAEIIGV